MKRFTPNEEYFVNKPHSNKITCIDIEDYANGNQCTEVENRLSRVNNSSRDKSTPAKINAASPHALESPATTCLGVMEVKHKWIYNVLWVAVHIFCITVSYLFIKTAYYEWQSSPVVQAVSTNQVHIENISFPAVTICWPNSFNRDYDFIEYVKRCLECEGCSDSLNNTNCNDAEMAMLAIAYKICYKYSFGTQLSKKLYEYVPEGVDGKKFDKYLEKLVPPCEYDVIDLEIYDLKSHYNHTRCDSDMFQQFYSNNYNTLCMTYNSLNHEDILRENVVTLSALARQVTYESTRTGSNWSYDNMMEFEGGLQTVPIHGLDALTIILQKQERYYENICKDFEGNLAFLFLHSPNEIHMTFIGADDIMIAENMHLSLIVEPKVTLAKDELVQYTPQQRGCFFSHEKYLALFKLYTQHNCENECRANLSLNVCGCVPIYYPRHNDSVKVCLRSCTLPKHRCDCLPDCNHLTYNIIKREVPRDSNLTLSQVDILLKGRTYYTTVRYSTQSYAEFLTYSLGVLGAFLGFSVTCVWKLLFFGFIRLWTSFKYLRHNTI